MVSALAFGRRLARLEALREEARARRPASRGFPSAVDGLLIEDEAALLALLEADRATAGREYQVFLPGDGCDGNDTEGRAQT